MLKGDQIRYESRNDDYLEKLVSAKPFNYLALFIILFVLMKPSAASVGSFGSLLKAAAVGIFACLTIQFVLKKQRISATLWCLLGLRIAFLIPTLVNRGDILTWGLRSVVELSLLMLIEYQANKDAEGRDRLLRALSDLFTVYLAINLVMVVFNLGSVVYINGYGDNGLESQSSYLLGIRTRIPDVLFPALLFAWACVAKDGKKWGIRPTVVLLLGIPQVVMLNIATAYVGLAVVLLVLVSFSARGALREMWTMRNVTVLGVFLTLAVVVFRVQSYLGSVFFTLVGKSPELTGRTEIWDNAFPILAESPFIGYGITFTSGAFVPWKGGVLWQAHDQYLQLAHDGGIIGVSLFIILLVIAGKGVDSIRANSAVVVAFVSVYAAMTVMAISEIYVYNMGTFLLIPFLASCAPTYFPMAFPAADGEVDE